MIRSEYSKDIHANQRRFEEGYSPLENFKHHYHYLPHLLHISISAWKEMFTALFFRIGQLF
jgi:hypothetical protein